MSINIRGGGSFGLNPGYEYYTSFLKDGGVEDPERRKVNSHVFRIDPYWNIRVSDATLLKFNLSMQFHWINKTEELAPLNQHFSFGRANIATIKTEIEQGLGGKLEDKLFIRFNHFFNLTSKGGDFVQLQLGYAKSIDNIGKAFSGK
ncbi:hypothetical protein [Negadavirga shengliensis]|uniref:Uncharacterized protein n=1 Tax=Negadavirga shengliensis TaxID=1389218 RepID=A0ABV9T891_9BACT